MATGAYIGVLTPISADLGWSAPVGATFSNGEFVKQGATNWSSGYINTTATASELEITATPLQNSGYCSFGLTDHPYTGDEQYFYPGTEYILYFNPGSYDIYELGSANILFSDTYSANDNFAIRVNNGVVTYYKNDTLVYTSSNPANGEYYCVVAAYTGGNGFNNISAQNTDPSAGTSSEVARALTSMYIGVSGVARKIKKAYIGVANIARLWWNKGGGILFGLNTGSSIGVYKTTNEGQSVVLDLAVLDLPVSGSAITPFENNTFRQTNNKTVVLSFPGGSQNVLCVRYMPSIDQWEQLTSSKVRVTHFFYNTSTTEYPYVVDDETEDIYVNYSWVTDYEEATTGLAKLAYNSTSNSYSLAFNKSGFNFMRSSLYLTQDYVIGSFNSIYYSKYVRKTDGIGVGDTLSGRACYATANNVYTYSGRRIYLYTLSNDNQSLISRITLPENLNFMGIYDNNLYFSGVASASGFQVYKVDLQLTSFETILSNVLSGNPGITDNSTLLTTIGNDNTFFAQTFINYYGNPGNLWQIDLQTGEIIYYLSQTTVLQPANVLEVE